MAITRNGVPLTPRQQKAYVKRITGWTTQEYDKKYDVFRNRVRNYERINGLEKGTLNPADEFARAAYRNAKGYAQSNLYAAINATTSAGTNTKLSARATARAQEAGRKYIEKRYSAALDKSPMAKQLYDELKSDSSISAADLEREITTALKLGHEYALAFNKYETEQAARGIIVERPKWIPDTP